MFFKNCQCHCQISLLTYSKCWKSWAAMTSNSNAYMYLKALKENRLLPRHMVLFCIWYWLIIWITPKVWLIDPRVILAYLKISSTPLVAFWVMLLTDKRTKASKNITSLVDVITLNNKGQHIRDIWIITFTVETYGCTNLSVTKTSAITYQCTHPLQVSLCSSNRIINFLWHFDCEQFSWLDFMFGTFSGCFFFPKYINVR